MRGEKKWSIFVLFPIFICLIISHSVWAYPGELDTSFHATDGYITYNSPADSYDFGNTVAIQSDGKIVVGGSFFNGSNHDALLVRYHNDGTIDAGFGTGGAAFYDGGVSGGDFIYAVALQPDGKILAAGIREDGSYDALLMRFNSNGTLDSGFGSSGIVTFGTALNTDKAQAVVFQPDGKIIVVGYSDNGLNDDAFVLRYTSNGALDTSFGAGGVFFYKSAEGFSEYPSTALLQPDGKIVVVGSRYNNTNEDIFLLRCNSNGTLDAGFGSGGIVIFDSGFDDYSKSAALQADGKIVVAGEYRNSVIDPIMLRFHANGSLDSTFGSGGVNHYNEDYDINAIVIQPDGKIIVAGETSTVGFDVLLLRLQSNGSLDGGFGTGGIFTFHMPTRIFNYGHALALQPDGNIVIAGYTADTDDSDVLVLRVKGGEAFGPDLTGGWTSVAQQCSGTGCKIKGKFNVQNIGNEAALSSLVRFYLSDDGVYDGGDSFLKEMKTGELKTGKSKSKSLSYAFPRGISATDKYIIAVIDADNTVMEANEGNNTIIYGPLLRANLTGMWTSLTQQCKGGKCKIKGALNIQNIGYQDDASSVIFYLSEDSTYDAGDMFLKEVSTGTLKVGKSKKKNLSYSFPSGVSASGKFIIAVIDADDLVLETNEGDNNIAYGPLP